MGTTKDKKKAEKGQSASTIVLRDYSSDPVFAKKHQEAIAFIEKYGLPGGIGKKDVATK
ncbi:hypothetical protein [Filimonas effusa]|uniref:hypothetical protein n=1 Tax=Filimonas effusa TaxID=2508721 RepID=UPI0013E94E52|nr:hypothetical protein [Filimonas effusa]